MPKSVKTLIKENRQLREENKRLKGRERSRKHYWRKRTGEKSPDFSLLWARFWARHPERVPNTKNERTYRGAE